MRLIHYTIRSTILVLIDFFYPPFKKVMPLQTFRYAACGGGNTLLNLLIFFLAHNYIFNKKLLHLGIITVSPHIAAFLLAFLFTFPIGFYLNMYVVFQGSYLRRRVQFFRYFLVVIVCIVLNYGFLKLFVDIWNWYPTPAMILSTALVIIFSYVSQRHFSFKIKKITHHVG